MNYLFFYFSARIILKFGLKTTLIITLIALVIRLSLYSVITNPFLTLPVELLHGVSWSLFWVVCVESVNKLVKNEWLATGQSLLYVAYYGVGTILGNYWTGYLSDAHYPISKIFLLNAGLVIMVIVFLWFCFKKMTKSANAF